MKTASVVLLLVGLFLFLSANTSSEQGLSELVLEGVSARKLLSAPQILIATVEDVSTKGKTTISRGSEVEVERLELSLRVSHVIKGPTLAGRATVEGVLRPTNLCTYIGRQVPSAGRRYVFFLVPKTEKNVFEPFEPSEFALRLERMPGDVGSASSAAAALKALAKKNAEPKRDKVLLRWLGFLGELFVADEDLEFWVKLADDARLEARGSAIAVLVERAPAQEGLYEKAMAFLEDDASIRTQLWRIRYRISQSLLTTVPESEVEGVLKKWLGGKVRELQKVALRAIAKTGKASLDSDVVQLLKRTTDRDIQYLCIVALSAMRSTAGPGWREFHKDPDRYVDEWATVSDD